MRPGVELDDNGSDRPLFKVNRGAEFVFFAGFRISRRFGGDVVSLIDNE